jgi:membrane-associated phospholipid phosphatase
MYTEKLTLMLSLYILFWTKMKNFYTSFNANLRMKIFSIFAMLLICTSGFGQIVSSEEFTLDKKYPNHEIDQHEDVRISPYSLDLTKELAIFGAGGVILGVSLILKNNIAPLTEEEVALLDPMDVNAFDRGSINRKQEMPAADMLLYGSMFLPLTFLAHEETRKDMGTLAVLAGEVFVFQLGLNHMAKVLTQRIRPYCYDQNTPISEKKTVHSKLSFYSGHTSTTAAMSFFIAKVFPDYLPNPDVKFVIWASAVVYPVLTGFLRIDSGKHFPTDILVGYVTGALIGYFIPVLHKSKLKDTLAIQSLISYDHVALRVNYRF